MSTTLLSIISAIGGATIALLSQHLKWINERNKLRNEKRKRFLSEVRNEITSKNYDKQMFVNSVNYSRLRMYISDKTKKSLENLSSRITNEVGLIRDTDITDLLDDIATLERKWNLI